MTTKILTLAHVPEGLEKAWLQHLRDFDVAHPGCHFEVIADAPEAKVKDIFEILRVHPGFDFMAFSRTKGSG
jgi:hypothetical protein